VGGHGKVDMTMSGGLLDANGSVLISDNPNGEGYITMTGGTMDLGGNVVFGWGDPNQADGGVAGKFTVNGSGAVVNASNIYIREDVHMGANAFEFELRQGTVNLTGGLGDFVILGSPQFGLFDMHGGKLTLDGDKVAHVESRITSGDLTANGAASSMISDFSIVFDGTETVVMLAGVANVPGDYNGNGVVDTADYAVWRDNVGGSTLPNRVSGIAGPIGQLDYDAWKARFGNTSGSGGAAAVPEPATIWGCLVVAWTWVFMRRKLT
jgi:hypothetical protein